MTRFPVVKLSLESYKERMDKQGQALTRFGKGWGQKPVVSACPPISELAEREKAEVSHVLVGLGLLAPYTPSPARHPATS